MGVALYLDDIRDPSIIPQGYNEWVIVRSFNEFVTYIENYGIPEFVSFDHDLAYEHYAIMDSIDYDKYENKTGMDCAKWLVDYCMDNNQIPPEFTVHSANPEGSLNILYLLNNFRRNLGLNPTGYRTFW